MAHLSPLNRFPSLCFAFLGEHRAVGAGPPSQCHVPISCLQGGWDRGCLVKHWPVHQAVAAEVRGCPRTRGQPSSHQHTREHSDFSTGTALCWPTFSWFFRSKKETEVSYKISKYSPGRNLGGKSAWVGKSSVICCFLLPDTFGCVMSSNAWVG